MCNIISFSHLKRHKLAKTSVFVIWFLIICSWYVIWQSYYIKYKDPNQPISVRINDLLSHMTLEEKIGQMTQIERKVAESDVMKNYFIGEFEAILSLVMK